MTEHPDTPAIELSGVCKTFGSVKANDQVDLTVRSGTIHGIIGENGAGKSTLMSILYGFYTADTGTIRVRGQQVDIRNSTQALALGIGMVHQHFMLVEPFTVLENIVLGAEKGFQIDVSFDHARKELKRLSEQYGLEVDPDAVISDLSVGSRQRVEILKALYRGANILILDEPTGVLTPGETEQLFRILNTLREEGVTILLITHKLKEIMAITDAVSVMRAGKMVAHRETSQTSTDELAELMVGRKVSLALDRGDVEPGRVRIAVRNLVLRDDDGVERLKSLNFDVRAGEIVGIAGVSGNGQSELLDVLSGMRPASSGTVEMDGKTLDFEAYQPALARHLGIAHIPEDRHQRGLVKTFSAAETSI
ncbi:MAG: ABC transporter ATP-binding protein, partial [Gammaproteobacteria bacterium]